MYQRTTVGEKLSLSVKKVNNSPFKIVFSKGEPLGLLIFDRFVHRDNFNEKNKEVVHKYIMSK